MLSEQELQQAAEFREAVHREALERVRAVFPAADEVMDPYPAESYFQQVWDYPGKWYTMIGVPEGAGSRKDLIETIVRRTLEKLRQSGAADREEAVSRVIAEYPDAVCEYCLVTADDASGEAESPFPYRGRESHRLALDRAARRLFADGEWTWDLTGARCRKLKSKALFAPADGDEWLNYRRAFLCPPHPNGYTDRDFDRVNAVLFPGGTAELEVYRWTTDWSDYFDEGHEWWGALCLTVYDRTLDRFTVILASASD